MSPAEIAASLDATIASYIKWMTDNPALLLRRPSSLSPTMRDFACFEPKIFRLMASGTTRWLELTDLGRAVAVELESNDELGR